MFSIQIDGNLTLFTVQLVFVNWRKQALLQRTTRLAEKLPGVFRLQGVYGEGHSPVATVEAQAELDTTCHHLGLEQRLGARSAFTVEPFSQLFDDEIGEITKLDVIKAPYVERGQKVSDDLTTDKRIGHDIGYHPNGMGRVKDKRFRAFCNGLADEQLVAVIRKLDPLQLAFRSLSILRNAHCDVFWIEAAPVDAGKYVGFVVQVPRLAPVDDYDFRQINFRRCKCRSPVDLPRHCASTGRVVLRNLQK